MVNIRKIVLLCLVALGASLVFAAGPSRDKMYVCVGNAAVKEKDAVNSKQLATVYYGDCVIVVKTNKNASWTLIKLESKPELQGWVPSSSLVEKKIAATGKSSSANAKEIALAGKGLNSTIEDVYSMEYDIDYSKVDKVESNLISYDNLAGFLKEGGLNGGEEE